MDVYVGWSFERTAKYFLKRAGRSLWIWHRIFKYPLFRWKTPYQYMCTLMISKAKADLSDIIVVSVPLPPKKKKLRFSIGKSRRERERERERNKNVTSTEEKRLAWSLFGKFGPLSFPPDHPEFIIATRERIYQTWKTYSTDTLVPWKDTAMWTRYLVSGIYSLWMEYQKLIIRNYASVIRCPLRCTSSSKWD